MRGEAPLSSSLPLEPTPNNSLANFNSLPVPASDLPSSTASSTGSIRGAVRALLRAQASASAAPEAHMEDLQPSAAGGSDRMPNGAFQEVPLSDSPRAVSFTAISRNSAHNIPTPAAAPSPGRSTSLGRPPPIQRPRKPPPSPVPLETSISGENGFYGDASTLDGISTFQVGQRREAPPPTLMSQHHVRSSSGGSAHEVLHGGLDHPAASSSSMDACEKTGLLRSQESGELVHSSSAAGPAAGPSGRGGGAGETKCNDTVVHVGDPGRGCCGMADPLLAATLIGVVVGIGGGLLLRMAEPTEEQIDLLGFAGELMLRLLKMLVLPLVAGSMVAGVCALRGSASSMARVARYTLLYYALSTAVAVTLGIILVNVINPGRGGALSSDAVTSCRGADLKAAAQSVAPRDSSPLQALLVVARSAVPDNVVAAAVNMNILGIITFSLFFGLCLSQLGDQADGLISLINAFNAVISRMVTAVLWTSPLGIASLIAAAICRACSLLGTLGALGAWLATVLSGLAIFGALILPAAFWALTRKGPMSVLHGFSRALVLAFGTSSSSAALPVAMDCAKEMGCDESIVRFVMPLGTTVNMNGTALYEATTVIFLAQAHGVALGVGGTVVVAVTATLAAIGAAAIPSAGLVTMLMVLQAVSLERFAADLAVVLALDWLLDRCRTAVNLLGDAFGVVLINHLTRHQNAPGDSHLQPYSQLELT
ncbi:g10705 [Coccomyxa elongata]